MGKVRDTPPTTDAICAPAFVGATRTSHEGPIHDNTENRRSDRGCTPDTRRRGLSGGTGHDRYPRRYGARSNGVVPGANVTIREVNRGTSDTYVTDETGSYTAPFLTPGTYVVEVNVPGFRKWVRDGVVLQVNQRARVDVTLEVGGVEETTTVMAGAPLLRTDSSEVGTVIEERAIKELPLNGAELRGAGLPDARDHARTGRGEPVGCQHVQSARRLELQRARPSGQRQRLADRRDRQQRVHRSTP